MKLEFVNAKKIDFVWLDKEVPRIAWDVGELEVLRADLGKNHNDLSKLEPRNAANLLKLFFVHIMDNDRDSEFAGLWGILKQKEKDTLDAALSGWGEYEIGLVLFNMVAVATGQAVQNPGESEDDETRLRGLLKKARAAIDGGDEELAHDLLVEVDAALFKEDQPPENAGLAVEGLNPEIYTQYEEVAAALQVLQEKG